MRRRRLSEMAATALPDRERQCESARRSDCVRACRPDLAIPTRCQHDASPRRYTTEHNMTLLAGLEDSVAGASPDSPKGVISSWTVNTHFGSFRASPACEVHNAAARSRPPYPFRRLTRA